MDLPVNPLIGLNSLYTEIKNELDKFFGHKYDEFYRKLTDSIESSQVFISKYKNLLISNIERIFYKPIGEIGYQDVLKKIQTFDEINNFGNLKENFFDNFKKADPYGGKEETMGSSLSEVKGSVIQKVGHILQTILGLNIVSFGTIGTFISWCCGFFIGPMNSIILSLVATILIHIIRKLATMFSL